MNVLLLALLSGAAFLVAYNTYGRWLGRKVFRLSAHAVVPSVALSDGRDFVPTGRAVVFGHHFTSIAGTGPIVGPAIAIMWGWLPALLWIVFGSIFIGAVHDFGALVVSLRNRGQTVGDIAGRVVNHRVRILFLLVLVMALTIVLAIFGLVIASVFRQFPAAIFPCVVQVPLALAVGLWLHRHGHSIVLPSLGCLLLMYVAVAFGDQGWLHAFNQALAGWPAFTWVLVLLAYSYAASVLPVWVLLQPRDFINSLQLLSVMGLMVLGMVVAAFFGGAPAAGVAGAVRPPLEIVAPVVNWSPPGAPLMFPFLFITIACGAISGFHCLVSSGTSSKQLRSECDARFVGYGAMLTEGFLAVMVLVVCGAAIGLGASAADGGVLTGHAAWASRYGSWSASLGPLVGTFVEGSSNLLESTGIPATLAVPLMGVFVASFAATTLDSACRLQRYVVQELASALIGAAGPRTPVRMLVRPLTTTHGATLAAVLVAAAVAALPGTAGPWTYQTAGTGGLLLWPLFGATNQLLAGLSFLVVAFYLWRRRMPVWFLVVPMIVMLVMPVWAMLWQTFVGSAGDPSWWSRGNLLLVFIALATCALEIWMVVEALVLFPKARGVLERRSDPGSERHSCLPPIAAR
jgi:carbon starvation protein